MKYKLTLYVGANNTTGEVEQDKLCTILNRNFTGYTLVHTVGYWEGKQEKAVMVIVHAENDSPRTIALIVCEKIKQELAQNAVAFELQSSVIEII